MRCDVIALRRSENVGGVKESKSQKLFGPKLKSAFCAAPFPNTIRHNVYEFTEQFSRHLISAQATEKKLYQCTLDEDISVTFLFRFCFVWYSVAAIDFEFHKYHLHLHLHCNSRSLISEICWYWDSWNVLKMFRTYLMAIRFDGNWQNLTAGELCLFFRYLLHKHTHIDNIFRLAYYYKENKTWK